MATAKKVDKRSKAYRDSLKKLPKNVGHTSYTIPHKQVEAMKKAFDEPQRTGISITMYPPDEVVRKSHQEQIQELQNIVEGQRVEIVSLVERMNKLETIVG